MKKLNLYRLISLILILFLISDNISALPSKELDRDADEELKKEVYLTFDDGPIPGITDKLLDVLKENNVRATFFVVGKEIKGRERLVRRMKAEGHAIGLHTYTHRFSYIYKSDEVFIHELDKTAYMIQGLIGHKPTAVRFPGGSDRILSEELLNRLHAKNYRVYDWNVNLADGDHPRQTPEKIFKNSKKVKGNPNRRFILAHCNATNINTCRALPIIIDYYKSEGFEFKVIDNDTKEYYYKFRNKK